MLTVSVDTADLDDTDATALRDRVAAAVLDDRPGTGRPDGLRVEVSVTDDEGTGVRARFDEHDAPHGAGELVGWVLACPAATRRTGR